MQNPVWSVAQITAGVSAVIALLVAFGVALTPLQVAGIMGVVAVAAPIVVAFVAAPKVTPLAAPLDEDGTPLVRPGGEMPRAVARGMAHK